MRRWFLSYHSPDEVLAERLKTALERKDTGARVFFAPSHLRAGGLWSNALADEIAQADAFILLVGEKGVGDWQLFEYDEALDRRVKSPDFAVVLVLLKGQTAPGLPFLRRLHWIVTADPASDHDVARLIEGAAGSGTALGELWRYTSPYRGLAAMGEKDSDYFFGRRRETIDILSALARTDGLPVLLGNSGVGKSSLAQAGVLAALKRQAWPEGADAPPEWPQVFRESRRWCFLTLRPGNEPLRALVEAFLDTWQLGATDPERVRLRNGWIKLLDGEAGLHDLLDATERRYKELDRSSPPAFLLYIDQGEELYVRTEERQRRRFSEVIAQGVADQRLYMLMSMRTDFLGELQKDEPLYTAHRHINVPPLREAALREVVSRPAELLSARFETDGLVDVITLRTAEDSIRDVGALPLLSYTLDDMWTQMVKRGDGVLRLAAQSFEPGGVLVSRADAFLDAHPASVDQLRHIFTLNLATVREGEEPTRRRALRSEFTDEEWRLVSELSYDPYRLLVTVTADNGLTYAEVAHETIFRRWSKLREWIAAEREFLAWRTGLEAAHRAWEATPDDSKNDPPLTGFPLAQAERWLAKRFKDIPEADRNLIALSRKMMQRQRLRVQTLVGALALAIVAGLTGWLSQDYLRTQVREFRVIRPYRNEVQRHVLSPAAELALKPGDYLMECARNCPRMVVVPAGAFVMGSPLDEKDREDIENPQHKVVFTKPFAASETEVTFDEWQACVDYGDCDPRASDNGWGRGRRPVMNVTWDDARRYAAWLVKMTGKPYRLLSEAEWEYAARAGTQTAYSWGEEIGKGHANCYECGSRRFAMQTAPVASFVANAFRIFDMHGNVWEWVEDCYHSNYDAAPVDGSAWTSGDCESRVARGGSWNDRPEFSRAASRYPVSPGYRSIDTGFRVGRTLLGP
jgi:formylglycine-generating enzyme required for sulfatase activity